MSTSQVIVHQVWEHNLSIEFALILQSLTQFPYLSIDTEFPGTIFNLPTDVVPSSLSPSHLYSNMKKNVDVLRPVQLGLTLSDARGRLPSSGTQQYVWQFNFRDFDCRRDLQNPESMSLLRQQGTNFIQNRCMGVKSAEFAEWFKVSPLGRSSLVRQTWITFHGLYDLGFLMKILTGRQLPKDLGVFMALVEVYLGEVVYDMKPMAQAFGLHGGLEQVAASLDLCRIVGKKHQAGSDSLLAMQVFIELKRRNRLTPLMMNKFNHQVHGLMRFSPMVYRQNSGDIEPPVRPTHNEKDEITDEVVTKKEDGREADMKKEG